jgi:hypothetical protein
VDDADDAMRIGAAAFHGSSHQAAMVFQVVVPKQLRDFEVGRHRLQFLYQAPQAFARVNQPDLMGQIKAILVTPKWPASN